MRERQVVSLRYGRIVAVEQTGFCPVHPTRPAVRSAELARLLPVGGNHAYDFLVRIGIAHFLECRQQAEVRADLASRFALDVPLRTIGHLARKFVAYVQVVHRESVPSLKTDMIRRGGYVLHVDGTCEEGSRVLLVCMDSVSGQVLDSRKIGSEGKAEVQAVLEGVRTEWGVPLAAVHDLGQVLFPAVAEVFPGVPQFVCHYHLAADVGKDVLGPGVDHLRKLFREVKLRPKLGVVVRSLRPFAVDSGGAHVLASLLDGPARKEEEAALPEATALGMIHGLVSWILAFSRTGNGYGFPFDVPYLELHERVVAAHTLLAGAPATGQPGGDRVAGDLDRIRRILAKVVEGERASEFARVAAGLRRDRRVFAALRERLRICPRDGKRRRNDEGLSAAVDPVQHRIILDNFRVTLRHRTKWEHGPVRACRIVLEHLDKYWPYLFGHRLEGTHGIVAPRTNNLA